MTLKLRYDAEFDILHWGGEGVEDAAVEIYPGVTLELDAAGDIIGVEVVNAGQLLGRDGESLRKGIVRGDFSRREYPAGLEKLLQPDGQGGYKEYWDLPAAGAETLHNLREALAPLWVTRQGESRLPA